MGLTLQGDLGNEFHCAPLWFNSLLWKALWLELQDVVCKRQGVLKDEPRLNTNTTSLLISHQIWRFHFFSPFTKIFSPHIELVSHWSWWNKNKQNDKKFFPWMTTLAIRFKIQMSCQNEGSVTLAKTSCCTVTYYHGTGEKLSTYCFCSLKFQKNGGKTYSSCQLKCLIKPYFINLIFPLFMYFVSPWKYNTDWELLSKYDKLVKKCLELCVGSIISLLSLCHKYWIWYDLHH